MRRIPIVILLTLALLAALAGCGPVDNTSAPKKKSGAGRPKETCDGLLRAAGTHTLLLCVDGKPGGQRAVVVIDAIGTGGDRGVVRYGCDLKPLKANRQLTFPMDCTISTPYVYPIIWIPSKGYSLTVSIRVRPLGELNGDNHIGCKIYALTPERPGPVLRSASVVHHYDQAGPYCSYRTQTTLG